MKWYLPKCMLNAFKRELSYVRYMLQYQFLATHLEYVIGPAYLCVVSSNE